MNKEQIFTLLRAFAINQSNLCKAANSRRGVTQKLIKEEKTIVKNLLDALHQDCTDSEISDLINSFG